MTGRFLRVNDRLCEITGYSREELLQKGFPDITHPGDIEVDWDNHVRLQKTGAPFYRMEKRYVHKSGRIVWVESHRYLARSSNGDPKFGVGLVLDISRRKQDEEHQLLLVGELERVPVMLSHFSGVMAGLVPAIHALLADTRHEKRGCPRQARA